LDFLACKIAQILAKKKKFAISLQNGPKLMLKTAIKLENLQKFRGGVKKCLNSSNFLPRSAQNKGLQAKFLKNF